MHPSVELPALILAAAWLVVLIRSRGLALAVQLLIGLIYPFLWFAYGLIDAPLPILVPYVLAAGAVVYTLRGDRGPLVLKSSYVMSATLGVLTVALLEYWQHLPAG